MNPFQPASPDQLRGMLNGLTFEDVTNPQFMDVWGEQERNKPDDGEPEQPNPQPRPAPRRPQPFATHSTGSSPMFPNPFEMARAGFEAHGKAIQNTNDAIRDEMDSRVSQEREYRRMMHEQEIERMRQETERMKIEALLARLNQESGSGRTVRFPGGSITSV